MFVLIILSAAGDGLLDLLNPSMFGLELTATIQTSPSLQR